MKRSYTVTITHTVEVDIADASLTPEALAEFSASIFQVDTQAELMEHAAKQVAMNGSHFLEGIGQAVENWSDDKTAPVRFTEVETDIECEEIKA